jgi:glycosyltransferase involved in cell wall biosynthesis
MYRSETLVGEVLETLLVQDFRDFAIVAIDDCSGDATCEVASNYAAQDSRLTVESNPRRLGMIRTWNLVLERARSLHPEFEFFAFTSDNDEREPTWLSALVQQLEEDATAALSYSRFGMIRNGTRVPYPDKWLLDTREIADPVERMRAVEDARALGYVMYGVHRRTTLDRTGDVPPVLFSDRLFLSHLALLGTFAQHPEVLWYRGEQKTGGSVRRQRAALFGARPPLTSCLPISIQHTAWLAWSMVFANRRPASMGRRQAAAVAAGYWARWIGRFHLAPWTEPQRRWLRIERRKMYRRWKAVRKSLRHYKRTLRTLARDAVNTVRT